MNRLLTLFITIVLALKLGAQEQNTFRTPDFNFPDEVHTNARSALDKALRVGDSRATVQALVQISLARTVVSSHEVTEVKELIDSVINLNMLSPDYAAILYMVEAKMLASLDNKWDGDPKSAKIDEWPRHKKDSLVTRLCMKCMDPLGNGDYSTLLTPITNYPGIINPGNELGQRCLPTLYDFLMSQEGETAWSKRTEHIKQLRKLHAMDKDKLALAYLDNKYGVSGKRHHKGTADYIYNKYGKGEELGFFFYDNRPSYKICKDYLRRYPSSPFSQRVRDYVADYEKKRVDVTFKNLLLPTDTILAKVDFTLTDTCMLSVYKVPTELIMNKSEFSLNDITLMNMQMVTRSRKKKKKQPTVRFAPLPVGYYLFVPAIATPEGFVCDSLFNPKKVKSNLMRVTELMSFDILTANSNRIVVVNAVDGSPVPEATVQITRNWTDEPQEDNQASSKDGKQEECEQTNSNGEAMIDKKLMIDYKVYKGDDYSLEEHRILHSVQKAVGTYEANIFTDLAIYRPGEKVQISAIAYYHDTETKNLLQDSLVTLVLKDSQRNEVERKELKTNESGSVTHTFELPDNLRNGNFEISVYLGQKHIGSKTIEVSEYKLPTYYIDLSETERHQRKGHRAVVRGRVMTYSGMPVVGAEIEGYISTNDYNIDDDDFDVETDAEGRFEYKLPRAYSRKHRAFHLKVECEDETGESHKADTWFSTGTNSSLSFNSGNTDFVVEEGKPVRLPISFHTTEQNVTTAQCSYKLRDEQGKVVAKGTFVSNRTEFDWHDIPSGNYRLTTKIHSLRHSNGFTQNISLYHLTDTMPLRDTLLWVPQALQLVDEKGVAHMKVFTSYPCQIYYFATDKHTDVASGWLSCKPGVNHLDIQIPKTSNNSLDVTFMACHSHNQLKQNIHLETPEINDVHLRTVTFRNKIKAGEHEHWSFRLEDADGKPLHGSMMLELYSKALEDMRSNMWTFRPYLLSSPSPRWGYVTHPSNNWLSYTYRKHFSYSDLKSEIASLELYGQKFMRSPKKPVYPTSTYVRPAKKMVNGIVTDQDGEAIIGATVSEVGHKNGTITDIEGRFSLNLSDPNSDISVAYVGYLTKKTKPQSQLWIVLQEDELSLNEVVVVGYGTQKKSNMASVVKIVKDIEVSEESMSQISTRIGDVKVALWRPDLRSDADGNFTLDFDVANENTTWCLQALAYTKELATDILHTEVLAQRPLMVKSVLPRFLRTGDKSQLKAKIENASDEQQQVHALIELFDPRTESVFAQQKYDLQIDAKGTETVTIDCPTAMNSTFVGFRVKAVNAVGDGDGEQQMIPVLPHTAPVVEAKPFFLNTKQLQYDIDIPAARPDSTSIFTLEYSDNPTWYCFEALPTMIDDDKLSSNGLAHSLFALAVADKVRHQIPAELLATDSVQYALLLDTMKIAEQRDKVIDKLAAMQYPNGGLSWMPISGNNHSGVSDWSTGVFVELMGDLLQLNCLPESPALDSILQKGLQYMDNQAIIQAQSDSTAAGKMKFLPYAYTRLLFGSKYGYKSERIQQRADSIIALTTDAVRHDWKELPLDERAFAALLLSRSGARKEAMRILESMRQLAVHNPNRGMYWEHMNKYSWFHPVACAAMTLQAYAEIAPKEYAQSIDEIRQWLLLEKQTSHWGNSSMAAHAIHALLLSGDNWLTTSSDVDIRIDGTSVTATMDDKEKRMVKISVPTSAKHIEITRNGGHPAWGALFHQYVAPLTEITGDSIEELSIRKEFWVKDNNEKWHEIPVDSTGHLTLEFGQNVQIRIFVKCGKDLENLVLKDERAAFLEPTEHSSGYRWKSVYYYQEVKDSCMKFYFERLPEGVYVITYDCNITHNGHYSCGIASIQSNYAPQYAAHSPGCSVVVK